MACFGIAIVVYLTRIELIRKNCVKILLFELNEAHTNQKKKLNTRQMQLFKLINVSFPKTIAKIIN